MKQNLKKRGLALVLSVCLICNMTLPAMAAEPGHTGLCEHHPVHTAECGYSEGTAGTPCAHEHTEDCYKQVENCVHAHTDECYPEAGDIVSGDEATPSDAEQLEPTECTHVCKVSEADLEETGCITKVLDCPHEHNTDCGFTEAVEGIPCGYVCTECAAEPEKDSGDPTIGASNITITAFDELAEAVREQAVPAGTELSALNLPKRLFATGYTVNDDTAVVDSGTPSDAVSDTTPAAITIEGVTWELDPENEINAGNSTYDPAQGSYCFTPVLPEGYALAEGVSLPEIWVMAGVVNLLAVDTGDFTVTGGQLGTDYSYANNTLTILTGTPITISGTTTQDKIVIGSGVTANITLKDVDIQFSNGNSDQNPGTCAFDMAGATVNLTLTGTNTLKSGLCKAGLHVPDGAALVIVSASTGSLTASCTEWGGAGIGGTRGESGGSITIDGGIVHATSVGGGAGIGGAYSGSTGGTITINGGTVTANGANGAGIGGGECGQSGGTITINGGTVIASGGSGGAGIGGGWDGAGGNITVSGGTVIANGSSNGAGIGGGEKGAGGDITITGGTVTAYGMWRGAGIGGGHEGAGGIINISNAIVSATGSNGGEHIGHGNNSSNSGSLTVSDSLVIKGDTGVVTGNANITDDFTIESNVTVTIGSGTSLTVNSGATLTNEGTITVEDGGTLTVENGGVFNQAGTLNGAGTKPDEGSYNHTKSKVTLVVSTSTVTYGGTVTLTATVAEQTNSLSRGAIPQRTVEFYCDGTAIGSGTVSNNNAIMDVTLNTALWKSGNHTLSAKYSGGNNNLLPSASSPVTLTVSKADQPAPAEPSAASQTTGSITLNSISGGVNGVEYSKDNSNWQDSTTFSGLDAANSYTFYARYKGNDYYTDSASSSTTIYTAADAPAINAGYDIDYAAETATAQSDYEISTDNSGWSTGPISAAPGGTLYVRVAAVPSGAPASAGMENTLPGRPAAPSGIAAVNETVDGKHDGQITGVSALMEYKAAGSWIDCGGATITGLAPDTYSVRTKATNSAFASAETTVTVGKGAEKTYTLNVEAPTFGTMTYGYDRPAAKPITIASTGNSDATITSVTVSDTDKFTIGVGGGTVTAGGSIATWTIRPAAALGAGTHTATITVSYNDGAEATSTVTFTVNKAAPSVTSPTPNTLTYTGNPQALVTAGTTTGGELQYSLNETSEYSTDIPTATNAGSYTVWYKVVGDPNYEDAAALSVTVTIAQKSISGGTVTLGERLTYTGSEQTQTVSKVEIDGLTVTYNVSGNTGTNAGNYTLTVTGTGNFTGIQTKEFTISKAANSITNLSCADIFFGRTPNPSASASFGTLAYIYSSSENGPYGEWNTANGAGTWYVKATVEETDNYAGATATGTFTVNKAAPSVTTPTPNTLTYTGNPQALVSAGSTTGGELQYSLNETSEYSTDIPTATNARSYTVWYKVVGDSNYEDAAALSVSVNITKASNSITNLSCADISFGRTPNPSASASFGTPAYIYSSNENGPYGKWSADNGAGTWYVKATVEETDNYTGDTDTTTFRVTAQENTPNAAIGYEKEMLTGLVSNAAYSIGGTPVNASDSGEIAIQGEWMGTTISIVKTARDSYYLDSAAQSLDIPKRPDAPAIKGTNESFAGEHDGQITGVSTAMQYKREDDQSWTDCMGATITSLAPGTYYVRLKVTESNFVGAAATVTIATGDERTYTLNVTPPTFADVTYGYGRPEAKPIIITSTGNSNATISGVAVGGVNADSFTLNKTDGTTIPAGGADSATYTVRPNSGLAVGTYTATITVTYDNSATATADVSFTVLGAAQDAPAAPELASRTTGSITLETVQPNANGAAAQYSRDGGAMWQDAPAFTGLTSNTKYTFALRYAATGNYEASPASPTAEFSTNAQSSGGGSDDTPSYTPPTVITPPATPEQLNPPTNGETTLPGKPDQNGDVAVTVPDKNITDAINAAKKQAGQNGISVTVNIQLTQTANSLTATISKTALDKLIAENVKELKITSSLISYAFNLDALKEMQKSVTGSLTITATKQDVKKLSAEAQTAIGSRPVFNLTMQSGGKAITSFGKGSASVWMPYTLQKNETAGNVQAVYVDAAGKVNWLPGSSYDTNSKSLMFITSHFSIYGVGCKAPTAFSDTANHWAKDDIDFVAARGLLSGTGSTTFSPNTGMTRGMFVTALGRLAGIDSTKYKNTKFTDVAATAYYAPYVAWATEKGITSGTGATTFSPDKTITRQELAVLMQNYAKTMGYTVPKTRAAVTFADNANIASWAKDAVQAMQMAGVIMGKDRNRFDPTGTATRAEVAAVLHRYVELVIDKTTAQGLDINDSGKIVYYENGKLFTGTKTIGGTTYHFGADGICTKIDAIVPDTKKYITHIIVSGDTLWDLSRKHGCTVAEIMGLNGIKNPNSIPVGTAIKIPQK